MQPHCPLGSVPLQNFDACGYPCENGSLVYDLDDSYCVGFTCPANMTKDVNDNSVCNKISVPKIGYSCDAGYTEWLPNKCFVDCPNGFRESGQSCIIPTRKRRIAQLICPYLSVLVGKQCTASLAFFWVISIFTIFVVFLAYKLSVSTHSKKDIYTDDIKISNPPPLDSAWRYGGFSPPRFP